MTTMSVINSFATTDHEDEHELDNTYGEIQRNGHSILTNASEIPDITGGGLNTSGLYQDERLGSLTSSPYLTPEPNLAGRELNLVSVNAIPNPLSSYLSLFYSRRVETRRCQIAKTLREVVHIAQEILHEVELQEPRFISTLMLVHPKAGQTGGIKDELSQASSSRGLAYYDGLRVLSPTCFEVTLFLNQMGVFNFVDDGSVPGGAVLKLSDGRKRSMSLWVEFITASGYLSARKIRARFHSLVGQALQKCTYRSMLRMLGHTSEVRICIRERYILQITPAFRCAGLWPRSASHWPPSSAAGVGLNPLSKSQWPSPQLVNEVKREGFCMLSQESVYTKDKQASAEGDAWLLDFYDAEERLLASGSRKQCLNILKTLADQHLTGLAGTSSTTHLGYPSSESAFHGSSERTLQEYDLKTLVLHECEKHPRESEWTVDALPDRINGVLLQLISCLQHRYCPHYFLPHLDIFRGHSHSGMDVTARQAWCLLRELLTCPRALEKL
ncbi:Cell fate determining protein mab21l2 [Fasciolopsis buskii]|uniref:Cell fate determining protein mab21l2 n=1 Tax=Fasciolopsis buskii TaxID=27845 RepID=A0A8E0RW57_9TREM|nr:Cell fate determining protein mab21l2 [Fasciolopsis buski]